MHRTDRSLNFRFEVTPKYEAENFNPDQHTFHRRTSQEYETNCKVGPKN